MFIFRKFKTLILMILILLILGFAKKALASDIMLNDLNGKAVNLSQSSKGKPVILFFWTTWCPYCRSEIKVLNQRHAQIEKEGIVVFGINVGEPDYKVQRFFKDYQLNFRMLLDQVGLLADKYGLMGVPTYMFLDKTGQMILKTHSLPENYKSLLFK